YVSRFGGLLSLYSRLGYDTSELAAQATTRQRAMLIRRAFMQSFLNEFPEHLQEVRATRRFRAMLKYRKTGLLISVLVARYRTTPKGKGRWFIEPPENEWQRAAIVGLMDENNASIKTTRGFACMNFPNATNFKFGQDHEWWQSGELLRSPGELLTLLNYARGSGKWVPH